ncbi:Conserved hypothetical protein [Brucella canis ATCC 23365]|uniref:Uncharacterized protein n=1 Tax=Brucella canis (strain ATCC 23365 / NCTC 10854 / RM-666) TaxID=483179 RepID=A9M625_BRUC2|nr:Conserved hypothetical protein [Brucella canis ATCC 23365]
MERTGPPALCRGGGKRPLKSRFPAPSIPGGIFRDGAGSSHHRLDSHVTRQTQAVALCEPGRIIDREPDLAAAVFPGKCANGKIKADGSLVLHQNRAVLRVSENDEFGRRQAQPRLFGSGPVIDTGENIHPHRLRLRRDTFDGFSDGVAALDRYKAAIDNARHRGISVQNICTFLTEFHSGQNRDITSNHAHRDIGGSDEKSRHRSGGQHDRAIGKAGKGGDPAHHAHADYGVHIAGMNLPGIKRSHRTEEKTGDHIGHKNIERKTVRQRRHHEHDEFARHRAESPADHNQNNDIKHSEASSTLKMGKHCAEPCGKQAGKDGRNQIEHGQAALPLMRKFDGIKLHAAEGRIAAEYAGEDTGIQHRAVTVMPVDTKQHRQISDDERPGNIDEKRAERKSAVMIFTDDTPYPPSPKRSDTSAQTDPHNI